MKREAVNRGGLGAFAAVAISGWVIVSAGVGVMLSALLLRTNDLQGGIAHWIGLFGSMFWIAAMLNAGFSAIALVVWRLFPKKLRAMSGRDRIAYVAYSLIAFNLAWIMWNHLQMAHQMLSVRPFVTTTGVVEIASIALIAVVLWFGGSGIIGTRTVRSQLAACVVAITVVAVLVLLDAREASQQRIYTLEEIGSAAGGSRAGRVGESVETARSPVIAIGIDGYCWCTAVPLLREGKLPALAGLLKRGRFGYLSNGDQSFSPPIWMTMFTGRPKAIHGVHGYQKLVISASGQSVPNLRVTGNDFDVFYGLNHLIQRLPSLGLWRVDFVSSRDRRVPSIWEVAGHYGKRVAVVNPIVSMPFDAVNGAIVNLGESWKRRGSAFQPPQLAAKWGRDPISVSSPSSIEAFEASSRRLAEEVDFTLELFREQQIDLGVFYTHFLDTVSHFNWDFHARDAIYLSGLPRDLSNGEWERLVVENIDDRVFGSYVVLDRQLGRFLDAFPDATFVVVSDHGWTYSGYEHFGSPDGVIVISGPGAGRGGEIIGARIDDIAPTIIALLGVPLSREFNGRALGEEFDAGFSPEWVASYDTSLVSVPADAGAVIDDAEAERLRAIGYID